MITSARAGSPTLSVTISGSDFLPGAEALFDEMPLPTIVRSDKELEASLSAELLAEGRAEEAVLRLEDLQTAERIFLGNSVRGLVPASMIGPAARPLKSS